MRRLIVPPLALASMLAAACSDPTTTPTSPQLSAPPAASFASSTSTSVNVTTTMYDTFGGAAVYTGSDDYNGSGFATYVTNTSKSGASGLTSQVFTDAGWQLYLGNQSTRKLHLVLAGQTPPVLGVQGTAIPDGYYYTNVEAYARCFDATNTKIPLLVMAAGTSNGNCTFGMDFSAGGTKYKLALGPDYDAAAATGRALVTCTAAASGSCTSWTIVPNDAAANPRMANLYHFANNGSLVFDHGGYHNSFNVAAAR